MPSPPDALLSLRLSGAGRAVLDALWSTAQAESAGEAWSAAKTRDLVKRTAFVATSIERALAVLRELGLVARARRAVAGCDVDGWRLFPVALRREPARRRVATRAPATKVVVPREKTPAAPTKYDDCVAVASVARRGDSEVTLAERLTRSRIRCSEGVWHKIKVHRRIGAMKRDLGITQETKIAAGDVAVRWRLVHGEEA